MNHQYKIHPAIGIARVGESPDLFLLAPERAGALPIACDRFGNTTHTKLGKEKTTTAFKDGEGRIKRQAARFKIFEYDERGTEIRELKIGDEVEGPQGSGTLADVIWTVHSANKKASWYQFKELEGEHGYAPQHPLRNARIQGIDRHSLNIDPGCRWVSKKRPRAEFRTAKRHPEGRDVSPHLTFVPIDSLGAMMIDTDGRLIVLGGYGNSASAMETREPPPITHYANNDGWFDDISDGPVNAFLEIHAPSEGDERRVWYLPVNEPAWAIVGPPSFVPELSALVTLDDVLYDLAVREFGHAPYMYGLGGPSVENDQPITVSPERIAQWRKQKKRWQSNYHPHFWRDIWPILERASNVKNVALVVPRASGRRDAHDIGKEGDFDVIKMSNPPDYRGNDPFKTARQLVYGSLRRPGQENMFVHSDDDPDDPLAGLPLMPLLVGDNPMTNTLPSKLLRVTTTQLFLLRQWAMGRFVNEKAEGFSDDDLSPPRKEGEQLDRGVLSHVLGGPFCPGIEVGWMMRNPSIYTKPYRIKHHPAYQVLLGQGKELTSSEIDALMPRTPLTVAGGSQESLRDLSAGLGPGDLTKYLAVPWQASFPLCSTNPIDVTFGEWNTVYPTAPLDPRLNNRTVIDVLWWPMHRPTHTYQWDLETKRYHLKAWAPEIPKTDDGTRHMVSSWKTLGFVVSNPDRNVNTPEYVEIPPIPPADEEE